jgi:hypothetical protein
MEIKQRPPYEVVQFLIGVSAAVAIPDVEDKKAALAAALDKVIEELGKKFNDKCADEYVVPLNSSAPNIQIFDGVVMGTLSGVVKEKSHEIKAVRVASPVEKVIEAAKKAGGTIRQNNVRKRRTR